MRNCIVMRPVRCMVLAAGILLVVLQGSPVMAKPEKWYQIVWCLAQKGEMEARLGDGSRVDCLTDTHAVEVEFASKWQEALGQSLHYALLTGKQAGIVLILKKAEDSHHWFALRQVVQQFKLPIKLWRVNSQGDSDAG